jgi:hypothetical protein
VTLSGNSAIRGIVRAENLEARYTTVADNTVSAAGGQVVIVEGILAAEGLLVAGNHGAPNCLISSASPPAPPSNVSDDSTCPGFTVGDARLGPLEPVDGAASCARGHRPGPGSVAIDVAGYACLVDLPSNYTGLCDAGAFEVPPE